MSTATAVLDLDELLQSLSKRVEETVLVERNDDSTSLGCLTQASQCMLPTWDSSCTSFCGCSSLVIDTESIMEAARAVRSTK